MKKRWLDIVAYTSNYSLGFTARPCLENKTKKLKISNQNNKTKAKCAHTHTHPKRNKTKIQKTKQANKQKTPQNKKGPVHFIKYSKTQPRFIIQQVLNMLR